MAKVDVPELPGEVSLNNMVGLAEATLETPIRFFAGYSSKYKTYADKIIKLPSVMLVTEDDEVYSIGWNNEHNILAQNDKEDVNWLLTEPKLVNGLSGIRVRKIVLTHLFGAAITSGGELFIWSADYELENPRPDINVVQLGCCAHCIVVKTKDNDVLLWGYFNKEASIEDFKKIPLQDDVEVKKLSCGWHHVALLDSNGEVWMFGYGSVGQLGRSWKCSDSLTNPTKVYLPGVCAQIECGALSTVFLLSNGEVYACGRNDRSDYLCVGRRGGVYKPAKVLLNDTITQIAAAYNLTTDGWRTEIAAYSTSTNVFYKWGDGSELPRALQNVTKLLDVFQFFCIPHSLSEVEPDNKPLTTGRSSTKPTELLGGVQYDGSVMRNWGIFDELSDDFIDKVESFCVYQDEYYESYDTSNSTKSGAYIITYNDEVFQLGFRRGFRYLFRDKSKTADYIPVRIDVLSWKKIKTILLGTSIGLALSRDGNLYLWRESGELELIDVGDGQKVTQVAGGFFLSLVGFCYLTNKNNVYFCMEDKFVQVKTPSKRIISLVSGTYHFAIQTEDMEIFTFSFSWQARWRFLGYDPDSREAENIAKKVDLPGRCKKVVCGFVSTNFLMENGDVYGCGLSAGVDEDNGTFPTKLAIPEPMKDIEVINIVGTPRAAMHSGFAGISESGKVYNWGLDRNHYPEVMEQFSSLIAVYEDAESPQIFLKRTTTEREDISSKYASPPDCTLFSDPLYSDVALILHQRELPTHKALLHVKSSFFKEKFSLALSNDVSISDNDQSYSENAMRAYLKSLYTGTVEESSLTLNELLDVTELAEMDGNHHLINAKKIMKSMILNFFQTFNLSKETDLNGK